MRNGNLTAKAEQPWRRTIGTYDFPALVEGLLPRDCLSCTERRLADFGRHAIFWSVRLDPLEVVNLLEERIPCTHSDPADIITNVRAMTGVETIPLPAEQDHGDILLAIESRIGLNRASV